MENFCYNHPDRKASNICHFCNEYYCDECLVKENDYYYCRNIGCLQSFRVENGLNYYDSNNSKSIIGIDFGTTKTIAAIYRNNRFEIITDSKGRLTMPSLVLVTPDDEIFVGWEAKLHPHRYVSKHITINSVKRVLGKEQERSWGNWKTQPQEIAALIFARLKIEVEVYLGEEINEAVLSIPAHFDINQRLAVLDAAQIAGFNVKRVINEATAAATYYNHKSSKEGKAIVVDIGGGTTAVSIVGYWDGVIEVISTAGDHYIGGDDFDQLIVDHLKAFLENQGELSTLTMVQEFVLRNAATNAKIELSNSSSTRIYLPAFIRREGRTYQDLDILFTRDQFNLLIDSYIKRIINLIDEAQKISELAFKDIEKLILIGGSRRIPKIREVISQHLNLKPQGNIDPEECVAKGAAVQAAVLSGNMKDVLLLDTYPRSLSVEVSDGSLQILIKMNTTIPTEVKKIFSTTYNNQSKIKFRFFEGESNEILNNIYLGELLISGIQPAPLGIPEIEVIVDIDVNGIIQAEAKDKSTDKKSSIRFSAPSKLNQAQIDIIKNRVFEVMKKYKNINE